MESFKTAAAAADVFPNFNSPSSLFIDPIDIARLFTTWKCAESIRIIFGKRNQINRLESSDGRPIEKQFQTPISDRQSADKRGDNCQIELKTCGTNWKIRHWQSIQSREMRCAAQIDRRREWATLVILAVFLSPFFLLFGVIHSLRVIHWRTKLDGQ